MNETISTRKKMSTAGKYLNAPRKSGNIIRKTVRSTIEQLSDNQKKAQLIPGVDRIIDDSSKFVVRGMWFVLVTLSFSLCLYQTYDRVVYYFQCPIAIDIEHVEDTHELAKYAPEITLCSQDTPQLKILTKNFIHEMKLSDYLFGLSLFNPLTHLVPKPEHEVMELWNATDISNCDINVTLHLDNTSVIPVTGNPRYHPFGLCAVYKLGDMLKIHGADRLEFKFRQIGDNHPSRSIIGDVKSPHQTWDVKNTWMLAVGTYAELILGMKVYKFLNTSTFRCWDDEMFGQCANECLMKQFKSEFTCKYPFFPDEIDMPICDKEDKINNTLERAATIYFQLNPSEKCGCLKSCNRFVFDSTIDVKDRMEKITEIEIYVDDNFVDLIKQRYLYGVVSLFCDIGGNLVLFMNITVLSLFELIFLTCRSRKPMQKTRLTKIVYCCLRSKKRLSDNLNHAAGLSHIIDDSKSISFRQKFLWTIIILSCTLLSSYQIYARIRFYFTYPTVNIIEVTENATMYYPEVTICGATYKHTILYKQISENRSINICEVPYADIVPNGRETLWAQRYKPSMDIQPILDQTSVYNFIAMANLTEVKMAYGLCTKLDIEPRLYSGSHTLHANILTSKISLTKNCMSALPQIYVTPVGQPFQPKSRLYAAVGGRSIIKFEAKKIIRLNHPKRPCVIRQVAKRCYEKCVDAALLELTKCELPFFNVSLPLCESNENASSAFSAYTTVTARKDPSRCGCHPECEEELYPVQVFSEPERTHKAVLIFVYQHNLIETMIEIYTFPLPKLCCDVGSWLGLTLGISITSMFDIVHVVCQYVISKCKKR